MQITSVDTTMPVQPAERAASAAPAAATGTTTTAASMSVVHLLNPRPAIDPGLGIVVSEYFNREGQETDQYPTAKALDHYRIYGLPGAAAQSGQDAVSSGETGCSISRFAVPTRAARMAAGASPA